MNKEISKFYDATGQRRYTLATKDIVFDTRITGNDYKLYIYLRIYGGQSNIAFPSLKRISKELNMSINTVRKSLKSLEENGYLKIVTRRDKNSYQVNNYYILDPFNPMSKLALEEVEKGSSKENGLEVVSEVKPDKTKKEKSKSNQLENEFNEWWTLYGKKIDKKASLTKFKTARNKFSFEDIMKGTKEYLKTITDKQYQKYPKTFLHNESFLNDYSDEIKAKNTSINGMSALERKRMEMRGK